MDAYDFLRKHALKNVFISPTQDRQAIVKPVRLTPLYGRRKFATVDQWVSIALPDETSTWHVYQIGGIHPTVFNYFIQCDSWTSLQETSNNRGMIAEAYVDSGIQLPRYETFYRYTENNSLILAVKFNNKLAIDFDNEAVFIRVYSNAFFNSTNFTDPDFRNNLTDGVAVDADFTPNVYSTGGIDLSTKVLVYGKTIVTPQDKTDLLNKETELVEFNMGLVTRYVNGILVGDFEAYDIKTNDLVELVYDGSVYTTIEFQIKDLEAFESPMDSKRKLLLHRPKDGSMQIDYQDDIDLYLIQKQNTPNGIVERGVYHHKNRKGSLRNLTHKDYSIVSEYIRGFTDTFEKLHTPKASFNADDMYIRMHIRFGGVTRTLGFEHQRILELYKLSDERILKAMVGLDATVNIWQAASLEQSDLMKMMSSMYNDVTKELAERVFRYNASSKYLADTPVKVIPNVAPESFEVPLRARHGCTVYEYDADGLLIGWHHHYTGINYQVKSALTAYAEVIIGLGGDILDEFPDIRNKQLSEVNSYRVYVSNKVGNTFTDFKDVTGSNKYQVVNGNFQWISPDVTEYPLLRSDARFYAQDYEVSMSRGQLEIELTIRQSRNNVLSLFNLDVPLGQIDVFLNRKSLIRGLDYFYQDKKIVIVNKEYLNDPIRAKQNIHIRFTGFCKSDLSIMDEGDVGFIEHGLLSNNNKYDIRDDKVQRVIVGGKFYHKKDLIFSEFHTGISIDDVNNGLPYLVKDILIPIKPYTVKDTYELRDQSIAVDKKIADYLTLKLPQPPRGNLMTIPKRYQVFSPFITKLIMDLRLGYLRLPTKDVFLRQEVLDICKPYEYLLKTDPLRDPNAQDIRFVVIHPHPMPYVIELALNSHKFMYKVVEEYGRGLITLSPSVVTI